MIPANIVGAYFAHMKPDLLWLYVFVHLSSCTVPILYLPFSTHPISAVIAISLAFYLSASARYALTMMLPIMAERKYNHAYGLIMVVTDAALTAPYLFGPLFAVPLINYIGIYFSSICIGISHLLYSILLVFLKNERMDL